MALKKYIIFDWSSKESDIADLMLGTIDHLETEVEAKALPEGGQQFGFMYKNERVKLAPNLMGGKDYMMKVLYTYSHVKFNGGTRVLAYYEIPRSEA